MLSSETVKIVQACIPLLEEKGEALVAHFYGLLMQEPGMAQMFNRSNQGGGHQVKALASAVLAYAKSIENPAALLPAVDRIARKHVALNVSPDQYQTVGRCLLQSLKEVAGAGEDVLAAWGEAYGLLAGIFIEYEQRLYQEKSGQPGGWSGYRRFRILRTQDESAVARSFYLSPCDGGPLMAYRPGQYLTLRLALPDGIQHRHYSLSGAFSPEAYRITVKREPLGLGSSYLHGLPVGAELEISAPAGEFHLEPEAGDEPLVMISAGIGVTPLLAMAESLSGSGRALHWLHAAQNGPQHSLKQQALTALARIPAARATVWYEAPAPQDRAGQDFQQAGRMQISRDLPRDAIYYLCGPDGFMADIRTQLAALGVAAERVRSEAFRPVAV